MDQNTSVPKDFDVVYAYDPTDYYAISNMTFDEAMEIGLFRRRDMIGRKELNEYERQRIPWLFKKTIICQAAILYSMIYETDTTSQLFGKQLNLTPENKVKADEFKKKHESLLIKYGFSQGCTTAYNADGRFVKEYRLVNWRDILGRIGWK